MATQNGKTNGTHSTNDQLKDSLVAGQTSQGVEIHAVLVRLTRYTAVFEIYNPALVLRTSEVINNFKIVVRDRTIYSGRAVVRNLVNASALICEVTLGDFWLETNTPFETAWEKVDFYEFLRQWQKSYNILPEFKIAVADMQTFLTDMRLWLDQIELGVRSTPTGDRLNLEKEIANKLGQSTTAALTTLFEKFEHSVRGLDPELQVAHVNFSRRQLHPMLLCAPFLYRTYFKPLGYAGDYEMVNMIARDPFEGSSLYAKILNLWFLQQAPAEAHRNRIKYLTEQLSLETMRVAKSDRPLRILSVGCGPAQEVQKFLKENSSKGRVDFTLLDFNSETLAYTEAVLSEAKCQRPFSTSLKFIKKSVHHMLKESGKSIQRTTEETYDMVYCAGLFDYLTDTVCRKLTHIFYEWLSPGGLLITTNVDTCNPRKITMDYIMEWHLNYRSSSEFGSLKPDAIPASLCKLKSDETGVNIYFEARKLSCA